jgi:predicted amidohydrolase
MAFIRIAQAQVNMVVGDFPGNIEKIIQFITKAREQDADIVTFPELSVCGYPPEDLLLKGGFLADNLRAIEQIKEYTEKIVALIGYADSIEKKFIVPRPFCITTGSWRLTTRSNYPITVCLMKNATLAREDTVLPLK